MVDVVWRRSSYDNRVHAFSLAQIASARSYLEALCSHTAPPVRAPGGPHASVLGQPQGLPPAPARDVERPTLGQFVDQRLVLDEPPARSPAADLPRPVLLVPALPIAHPRWTSVERPSATSVRISASGRRTRPMPSICSEDTPRVLSRHGLQCGDRQQCRR